MTAPSTTTMTAPSTTTAADADPTADRRCAACDHRWETHDAIAVRFCAATIANSTARGCVCDVTD